jgi:redox-sensing transcriptional repressor
MVEIIGKIIDTDAGQKMAVIGMGNLGKAFIHYLYEKRTKLKIVAAFDVNPDKINMEYADVPCYHLDQLEEIIKKEGITIGIITTPPEVVSELADRLKEAGIKGILNYTPKPLSEREGVYLEEYDMITSLEKVAYFVKH